LGAEAAILQQGLFESVNGADFSEGHRRRKLSGGVEEQHPENIHERTVRRKVLPEQEVHAISSDNVSRISGVIERSLIKVGVSAANREAEFSFVGCEEVHVIRRVKLHGCKGVVVYCKPITVKKRKSLDCRRVVGVADLLTRFEKVTFNAKAQRLYASKGFFSGAVVLKNFEIKTIHV
jgi:hypothetical protein